MSSSIVFRWQYGHDPFSLSLQREAIDPSIDERLQWPLLWVLHFSFFVCWSRITRKHFQLAWFNCFIILCSLLQRMKAGKCPSDELSLTNCAVVNPQDFNDSVKSVYFAAQHPIYKDSLRLLECVIRIVLFFCNAHLIRYDHVFCGKTTLPQSNYNCQIRSIRCPINVCFICGPILDPLHY